MIKNIDTILKDKKLRIKFIKSVDLNDEIFDKIINSSLVNADFIYLSSNNTLKKKHITLLFQKNIDNVNINLLRNELCPEKELNNFLELNDKIYNIAIAHNKSINKLNIKKLLAFNDPDVTMSLRFNNFI